MVFLKYKISEAKTGSMNKLKTLIELNNLRKHKPIR